MIQHDSISSYADIDTPALLDDHYRIIHERWWQAMTACALDVVILHAGETQFFFEDDQGPRFQANPHLVQWIPPEHAVANSCLLLTQGQKACLLFHQPEDYWHATPQAPEHLAPYLEVKIFPAISDLKRHCIEQATKCSTRPSHIAFVGPLTDQTLLQEGWQANPAQLIHRAHFARANKTEYELAAMRNASEMGAVGHAAAAQCFADDGSEFDIHMAFLTASAQNENQLPYGNIVAQNENAAFLHYQFQQRTSPAQPRSLLIDAGGSYRGYASDITRTYVKTDTTANSEATSVFLDLLERMQRHQDSLIAAIAPGQSYLLLQQLMHRQLGQILVETNILQCSAAEAFEAHLTEAFCPHGLGHLLGLQVHDVGGQQISATGDLCPPPDNYPSLRFTRPITQNMVLTVEPGVYFIPALLNKYDAKDQRFNWPLIESLICYGGIRIEDNVRVLPKGVENLTRDAFSVIQTRGGK